MLTIIKKNKDVSNEDTTMLKKKKKRSLNNSKKTDKLKIYLSSSYSSNIVTNNSITKNTLTENKLTENTLTENTVKEHTVIKHTVKEEITCNNLKNIKHDTRTNDNINNKIDKEINKNSITATEISCQANIINKKQITSDNGKDQKIIEFYMECLEYHKKDLNKNKLTVWMQVGSFFEVYGLIYPDGKKQGNVWEVASDLDIKVANKKQTVYDNSDIKVYMAGAKEEYAEPYLETLIDKYGWTVAVYTQEKINNSNKIVRVLKKILSPGINFDSDNITNNYVYIYFKSNANRLTGKVSLHIGIFYVDCISGENGIQELYARDILDCNVVLSEVIKLITIKNPSELIIHMDIDNYEIYNHLSRDECYSTFGLFNRNVNFIVNECPKEFYNIAHQKLLLENVYHAYMSRGNIFDNLGLNNQNIYGRVVLCLGINNIFQHDSSIIAYLEKPTILKGDMSYLMLANNCLQQLDIISSDTNNKVSMLDNTSTIDTDNNILNNISSCNFNTKKKSLLDILDKTKTVMGRRLFKSRLSMPIINKHKLETCYQEIADMQALNTHYLVSTVNPDYALSPYNKIRSYLGDINDISKILRKIITNKAFPNDIVTLYDSINAFTQLHSYIKKNVELLASCNSIKLLDVSEMEVCSSMLNSIKSMFEFENCVNHWALFNNSFFNKGVNANVDTLQDELFKDRDFFLLFKKELTIIINPDSRDLLYNPNLDSDKLSSLLEINEGSNAKLNRYVYCNEKNMNKILSYIKQNPSSCIKIGNYNIKLEMIKFSLLRKGIYHINTPYIDIASRNYVSNLDELKKLCISEFKIWCKSFYLSNNMNINKYIKWISTIDVIQSCAIIADKYGYTRPEIYNNYHTKFTLANNNDTVHVNDDNANDDTINDVSDNTDINSINHL
jgi:DNA mismatch repair ATPase MutS